MCNLIALWCLWSVLSEARGYNIDVDHPVIIEDPAFPSKAYFGSSIALHGAANNDDQAWIKIGAPNGSGAAARTITGVVYHCPFMKACDIDQALNYTADMDSARIGAAMDISYNYESLAISASSMQKKSIVSAFVQGISFIEQLRNKTVDKLFVLKEPTALFKLPYYGRALSGFSLHFVNDQNELVVGAPGVYNYLGTVFRVKDIDKPSSDWKYDIAVPKGNYYEYAGYAVTSGYFHTRTQLLYVAGLPRGVDKYKSADQRQVPYGAVVVFAFDMTKGRFKNEVHIQPTDEIYGTQFGEYFGSALASGDLNADGLDDLIVAAPFRQNSKSGFDHGSVYVFYGNARSLQHDPKNRIEGVVSGARFGAALTVLGRLDKDSAYPALAISAPNEEDCGVVYIYSYNDALKSLRVIQRIVGKEIYVGLRGFGMSFSRSTDVDANGVPDFAVGSPISGHAVLFRSKPTVTVHASLSVPTSMSKSSTHLVIKCCYHYTGYRSENLSIIRTLKVDPEFDRFYFNDSQFRSSSESKLINIKREREQCEETTVTRPNIINFNDPISLELSYELAINEKSNRRNPVVIRNSGATLPNLDTDDTFCKNCPILSRKSKKQTTKLVMWDHLCEHDGRKENCTSELVVTASFLDLPLENTCVLGNKELLSLRVTVTNKGDPAFMPSLQIILPSNNGIGFVDSTSCHYSDVNVIRCEGDEILYDTLIHTVKLNVYAENTEDRNFLISTSTITDNLDGGSSLTLTLKLRREADLLITGYSEESSYVYQKGSTTTLQNIFKVEKFGPSPSLPAEITVTVPYKMKSAGTNVVQFASIMNNSLHNPLISCRTMEDVTGTVKPSGGDLNSTIYNLDCAVENLICARLKCDLAPLEDWQNHAEFPVNMQVDLAMLEAVLGRDFLALTDHVVVSVEARISTNFTQTGDRTDFAKQSNIILVDKQHKIPLWILICSLVVGLLILVIVTVLLAKLGFFERKKHIMLQQLKEAALEEEQKIEEMIQKESEEGEPLESDIMFRYISPKDLDIHWKH